MLREPKLTFSLGLLPQYVVDRGWTGYFHISYMDQRFRGNTWTSGTPAPDGRLWSVRSSREPAVSFSDARLWLQGREPSVHDETACIFTLDADIHSNRVAQTRLDCILAVLAQWADNVFLGYEPARDALTPEVKSSLADLKTRDEAEDETPAPLFVDCIRTPKICLF